MVIENCTVLTDVGEYPNADVLFKDNGWVRVTAEDEYHWLPPHAVNKIKQER